MKRCLCALAVSSVLLGCRSSFDLSNLQFDRTPAADRLAEDDESLAGLQTSGHDHAELQQAAFSEDPEDQASGTVVLTAGEAAADRTAEHLRLAQAAAAQGEVERARLYYERVLAARPDHPEAHHRLGVLADQRRDYETAARHYMRAVQQKPDDPDLLNDIGYSFLLQGRPETAERYLREALRAQPSHARARANLALLQRQNASASPTIEPGEVSRASAAPPPDVGPAHRLQQQVGATEGAFASGTQQRQSAYAPPAPQGGAVVGVSHSSDLRRAPQLTPRIPSENAGGTGGPGSELPAILPKHAGVLAGNDAFPPGASAVSASPSPAPRVQPAGFEQVGADVPRPAAFPTAVPTEVIAVRSEPLRRDPRTPNGVGGSEASNPATHAASFLSGQPLNAGTGSSSGPPPASYGDAVQMARRVGMEVGPGIPFPILREQRAGLAASREATLAAGLLPVSESRETAPASPGAIATGTTVPVNDPVERFQREVQQYEAQLHELNRTTEAAAQQQAPSATSQSPLSSASPVPQGWPSH